MHCAESVDLFLHSVAQLHHFLHASFGWYHVMHELTLFCSCHRHNVARHQHLLDYSLRWSNHIAIVFYNTVQVRDRIVSNTWQVACNRPYLRGCLGVAWYPLGSWLAQTLHWQNLWSSSMHLQHHLSSSVCAYACWLAILVENASNRTSSSQAFTLLSSVAQHIHLWYQASDESPLALQYQIACNSKQREQKGKTNLLPSSSQSHCAVYADRHSNAGVRWCITNHTPCMILVRPWHAESAHQQQMRFAQACWHKEEHSCVCIKFPQYGSSCRDSCWLPPCART